MASIIEIIYADDTYERIRFYFQELGYKALEDLSAFNFDELMFVPGVNASDIKSAEKVFLNAKNSIYMPTENHAPSVMPNEALDSADDKVSFQQTEKTLSLIYQEIFSVGDAFIVDIYQGVPRRAPFINMCLANGKRFMSQLTDADFDDAARINGLGIHTAENLRAVYKNYHSSKELLTGIATRCPDDKNNDEVSDLPLSARAINCLISSGVLTVSKLQSLSEIDLMSIKNMGVKTCREILSYCETISIQSESYYAENVDTINEAIPIALLKNAGISQKGIETLLRNGYTTVMDLRKRNLSPQEYALVQPAAGYLAVSVIAHFKEDINALRDTAKACIIGRCKGDTLKEIGDRIGITRERVRQILVKACRSLQKSADLIAGVLFTSHNNAFAFCDLQDIFGDQQISLCCKLVLQESNYVMYFKFSDKFVCKDICPPDIDQILNDLANETIGQGLNYYDNIEMIEYELKKRSIDFFDFEDIMNYLVYAGYHFYGDYVMKGKQSYVDVCYDAVRKFFAFDIKLDSNEGNEDMRLLRYIIEKHYQGLAVPPANRALTAAITRDANQMVLSGRGRYCPIEKVIYNISLLDEVRNYIESSSQTSFYYSELYTRFEGRFLAETNIASANFLHGMLKYAFPDEFTYERDMLVKNGSLRQDVNDRLKLLLKEQGHSMTKAEIRKAIPGINDFVIAFSVARLPEIIQWDYNELNHIENIEVEPEDTIILRKIIKEQTSCHSGYCSETLLFAAATEKVGSFLKRNRMQNAQNLYYAAGYFFGEEYRFKRPHIVTKDFPVQELSVIDIARVLLECDETLNYEQYCKLAGNLGWAGGTLYAVFSELEKDYIRVAENDYIHKKYFNLSSANIQSLTSFLNDMVLEFGYYPFGSIFNYEAFPKCKYQWNSFLLESIITEYNTGFRIIHPQVRDRRYQRGVIVPDDSPYITFEDLIVCILKTNNISTISEAGLEKLLKLKGIIAKTLPQEIYEFTQIVYKNELFSISRGPRL